MPRLPVLIGQRFGRWVVIAEGAPGKRGKSQWLCRCDCGVEREVGAAYLRVGSSRSCGCARREAAAQALTKHGFRRIDHVHPLYGIWKAMRQRCLNPNSQDYRYYGGRGITICERWDDFAAFVEDMGEKPGPEYSIDRIDNDGPYSPENCRWATAKEQNQNKRKPDRAAELCGVGGGN